jgi:alpha-methylacyl-CoA racemase
VLRLCERADALIEGFRPGVMERLGLGPGDCFNRNEKLVYGRMTGWGQEGPLAQAAGHDANYISLAGALHTMGLKDRAPILPLNLIGDFGGGGLLLAFGVVAAMFEAQRSGKGQVVDAAILDGAASLMALIYGLYATGAWMDERESNFLDGGSHFYNVYETSDGKYISICALEPQFYRLLLEKLNLDPLQYSSRMDRAKWPQYKREFAGLFKQKTRDEWCALLEGTDVCFAPVLSLKEVSQHPHNIARGTFITHDNMLQPAPSPRFSRTPPQIQRPSRAPGQDTRSILAEYGFSDTEIESLLARKTVIIGSG